MTFLSGFQLRKAIKYGSTRPSSSLTAFPLLISVTGDTDVGTELTTRKMAVTLADGTTQVPYGSQYFNSVGGSATFSIRAKFDLSGSANQGQIIGYLYYDHTATDQQDRLGTVSGFTLFHPLEDDPSGSQPQMVDWTGNYNGSVPSAAASSITSQVASGLRIDTTQGRVVCGQVTQLDGATTATLSTVMRTISGQPHGVIVVRGNTFGVEFEAGGVFTLTDSTTGVFLFADNNGWHQFDLVYDGSQSTNATKCKLYVDGSLQTANSFVGPGVPASLSTDSSSFIIGSFGLPATGDYDETTLALTARSSAWIAFNYANQFSNSATVTLGDEESSGRLVNSLRGQAGLNGYLAGLVGLRKAFSGNCGLREYNSGEAGER